jgi:PAS domain S-box-containing protein
MGSFNLRRALRKLGLTPPEATNMRENLAYKHYVFQEIAKNMSQVFWADSYDKSVSILNVGNYSELFGRPVSNLKHNNLDWLEAVHPEDRPRIEAALPLQLTGRFDEIYRVIHPDGSVKWLRDRAFLISDRDGKRKLRAGIVEDVTTAVLAEEQLRHDSKMRAMGSIAGGISHDFNNILAIIQGNLELAGLDLSSENAPRHLDTALEAATRGASLTHRLLAYARRQPLNAVTIEPAALIKDVAGLLESTIGAHSSVKVVADDGVWNCRADLRQFETVLLNLAINARDAMPKGGEITISAYNVRPRPERCRGRAAAFRGRICLLLGQGRRRRHATRNPRPRVRALLHHQERRRGFRPRPRHGLWLRRTVRRAHQDRFGAGPWNHGRILPPPRSDRQRVARDRGATARSRGARWAKHPRSRG